MIGELTVEEKISMTANALKTLNTQLFEMELNGIVNRLAHQMNPDARRQHDERVKALKAGILQLQQKHSQLEKEKVSAEPSSPSNQ
jgi:hypothetical protein